MARNRQLVRELTLLQLLERARVGHTIDELARDTGVTTRTIRRDIEALEQAGTPIVDDAVNGGRRWCVPELAEGGGVMRLHRSDDRTVEERVGTAVHKLAFVEWAPQSGNSRRTDESLRQYRR
jgi:predicted ArsR family transcriptional regulator